MTSGRATESGTELENNSIKFNNKVESIKPFGDVVTRAP